MANLKRLYNHSVVFFRSFGLTPKGGGGGGYSPISAT